MRWLFLAGDFSSMTSTPSDFLAASRFATRLSQKWLMSKEVAAADGNLLTLELICLVRRRGDGGFVTRRCLLREKRPRPVVVAVAGTTLPRGRARHCYVCCATHVPLS